MGSARDLQLETCLVDTNILLAAGWLDPGYWWGVAQVIIGLGFVIFVHELGHFLVAKACGVKCEKFYVGFDFFDIKIGDRVIIPRSLVKWNWGETEYGVGIVPLGGYVKMLGQDDNPANREEQIALSKAADASDDDLYEPSGLVDRTKMDPRSFLAKTVPQRMAIISAGVIFNILFAILLAAIAFRSGVLYEPAKIGGVTAGGPAWEENMGESTVLRVGEQRFDEGYSTFIHMAEAIIFDGSEENAVLEIEYVPKGESESKTVKLTPRKIGTEVSLPRIGVTPMQTLTLAKETPTQEGRAASNTEIPFLGGDTIVKANGVDVDSMLELQTELVDSYGRDITVTVERKTDPKDENAEPETVEIAVTPDRMPTLGIACEWLPIKGIKRDSVAAKAGFEIGDKIVSVNGEELGSLFTLDLDVIKHVQEQPDQPIVFVVERGETKKTIEVVPTKPRRSTLISGAEPVGIETLGLAIPTSNIVSSVAPGSPAEEAGIKKGDELVGTQAILTKEQKADPIYSKTGRERPYEEGSINFSDTHQLIQQFPVGQEFKLSYKRGDDSKTVTVQSVDSDEYFRTTIGVRLTAYQEVYTAKSWGEAFQLGAKQTWVDLTKVFKFLGKLVRGRISAKNLGGPGTIFVVAQSEATQGTSRLLLFLVLLSANLAIINFLPIPVLDGGHMMFLAYEGLFRKPVTERVQVLLTYIGFLALLSLMAFVIWQDVGRISRLF